MRILVIGSGGREHAIVRALSAETGSLHAAPGNPGIAALAETHPGTAAVPEQIVALARELSPDLVIIGPEAPLVAGAADALREHGVACFGPDAAAARIEGSKSLAKQVMAEAGIATAPAASCTADWQVDRVLAAFGPPYVVKADGLAAGKGVLVTEDLEAARAHARACGTVVIEEFLDGPEVSLFAVTDGVTAVPLLPAQDFKRARDGDQGPNTGGMGAYAPLPWAPADLAGQAMDRVIQPAVDAMARRGTPYRGLLYAGLALTSAGLKVIEFNARFGDPETQVVLDRLASPLGPLLHAAAAGGLAGVSRPEWRPGAAVVVVIAAEGYPAAPVKGDTIHFSERSVVPAAGQGNETAVSPPSSVLKPAFHHDGARAGAGAGAGAGAREAATGAGDAIGAVDAAGIWREAAGAAHAHTHAYVLHAGTAWDAAGELVSAGGRVLNVVGSGADVAAARAAAYELAETIEMRGGWYRRDIAAGR
ncbi:MAG: phosphoribosylamine--glycine ligase [Streptosporangiaceae bacterium]